MIKSKFSLRYKILSLLTLIPLVSLVVYIYLAVEVFKKDKVAYVTDSSSSVTNSVASQVKSELGKVLLSARPLMQDFASSGEYSDYAQNLFKNESSLDVIFVLEKSPDGAAWIRKNFLEKKVNLAETYWGGIESQLNVYLSETLKKGRYVKNPFLDERIFLFELVKDKALNKDYIFILVSNLNELSQMFTAGEAQNLFLVFDNGDVLFGDRQAVGQNILSFYPIQYFEPNKKNDFKNSETIIDRKEVEQLVTLSKVGFGDLVVISLVAKSKALSAVELLMRKSIVFFILLLSVTITISLLASNSLTSALLKLFEATKNVAQGNFSFKVHINSSDEVGVLAENFNRMSAEVSRLLDETAEKARMESELNTAKTVQETLFPNTDSQVGNLQISGFYESASECGGDWWHYCIAQDKIFLWVGDATGHGVPAALLTSAAKSAASIIENLDATPSLAMSLLNQSIYDVSKGKLMMTFFIASFDPKTSELVYANASHEAPYLIRKNDGNLKKKDLIPLNDIMNPRLGQARDTMYEEVTIDFNEGDLLYLYTDGVPDIQDPAKNSWGEREFIKTIIESAKLSKDPIEFRDLFVKTFQDFRQNQTLIDDVTFFVVKNKGVNKG